MHLLLTRCETFARTNPQEIGHWLTIFGQFFLKCTQQISLDTKRFGRLAKYYTQITFELGMLQDRQVVHNSLEPLERAIRMIAEENELTTMHMGLMRACILTKRYSVAYPYATKIYLSVNKEKTMVQPSEVIQFFYYAGCVCAALKKWEQALHLFDQCIAAPCSTIHAAQLDSYKKHLLISLALLG